MARSRTQPALVGHLSPSKKAVYTKDHITVLHGRDAFFLTPRELDALVALRAEFQAQRAVELREGDV